VRRLAVSSSIVAAVLAAAGCGGGAKHYTLDATRSCLRGQSGVVVRPVPPSDVIAQNAIEGATNVKVGVNQVTLVFSENPMQAENVAKGYRRLRGKGIGISALETVENVMLVWGVAPQASERTLVHGCLKA
jgi:hypothetical protein